MKKRFLLAVVAVAITGISHAITIDSPGVVGKIDINGGGVAMDPTSEAGYFNTLLGMVNNTTQTIGDLAYATRTIDPEYAASLLGGVQYPFADYGTSVPAGAQWVLAKYDGQSAGFIGFYFPDAGSIPEYPWEIWGEDPSLGGNPQFKLSHFTVFTVPDNGDMVGLLGLGLLVVAFVRRMFPA